MKLTRAELLELYLKFNGFQEVQCRSRKYREFRKEGWLNSYFIGTHGAFRKGTTASKSRAIYTDWKKIEVYVDEKLNQEVKA